MRDPVTAHAITFLRQVEWLTGRLAEPEVAPYLAKRFSFQLDACTFALAMIAEAYPQEHDQAVREHERMKAMPAAVRYHP